MKEDVNLDKDPRSEALQAIKSSVPVNIWENNGKAIESLRKEVENHPLLKHPILCQLNSGQFDIAGLTRVHLEYRYAIVQVFTDALLMAQFQARQLEPRLPSGAKMPPRFLLTLNVLDEFGFEPSVGSDCYYRGTPTNAHYPLYEQVLNDLSLTDKQKNNYKPSEYSLKLNEYLSENFDSYDSLIALLAAAEQQVITFSPALRNGLDHCGVDVSTGYYHVHGTSDHEDANAYDDDHQDDLWIALRQAVTHEGHERIRKKVLHYLDLWLAFWDYQAVNAQETSSAGIS